jgi:AcrR family transcriptional regulator
MASSLGRVRMRRPGTPGPRGGGVYVTELQRARLLDAAFAVVSEDGYRRMTARRVSGRAGVSNKTFYDLFTDREDCFLGAFDHAVEELAAVVLPAWEGEGEWATRVRAGLGALLGFLDGEPALRRLVFVEALGAGTRVLERRARVLGVLEGAVDQGRAGGKASHELPPLTAEGVVGAVFGVVHTRLLERRPEPLTELCNPLMATIVLPYRGSAAAARELSRPAPEPVVGLAVRARFGASLTPGSVGRARIPFRLTVRTHLVLCAVAELAHLALSIPRPRLPARGACSNVTTPSPVAFEEAPARAPSRAGSRSAERRGPDPGLRRSPIFFPRPLGALSHNNNRGAHVPSDS